MMKIIHLRFPMTMIDEMHIHYSHFVIIDNNGKCDILPFVTSGSFRIRTVNQKLLKYHVYIKTLNSELHIEHFLS